MAPRKYLQCNLSNIVYTRLLLLRVGDVDREVEGGADDEVELVPAALIPVQAGPGDHPLQQGGDDGEGEEMTTLCIPWPRRCCPRCCSRICAATAAESG